MIIFFGHKIGFLFVILHISQYNHGILESLAVNEESILIQPDTHY
jgi:hypothetical protein